ncbi:MAG: hypothetical protein NTY61_00235 [Candidatus Parcubacteria bacterium]|nr:hypothetical protein [Candidatus Parcubacteria bacterium]
MKKLSVALLVIVALATIMASHSEAYTVLKGKYSLGNTGLTGMVFYGENHVFVQAVAPIGSKSSWFSPGVGPEVIAGGVDIQMPLSVTISLDSAGQLKLADWSGNVYLDKKFGPLEVASQNTWDVSAASFGTVNYAVAWFNHRRTAFGPEVRWSAPGGAVAVGAHNFNKLGPLVNENYVGIKNGRPGIELAIKTVF